MLVLRSVIFPVALFVAFSIALFGAPLGFAAGATNQTSSQSQTAVSQPWLIEQIIELQTKSAKLEATLQQQHLNNADIKNAEAELHNLQIQLTELKERLSAQGDNQVKELASVSKRVDDVLWLTNTWGFVLSVWGLFAAIGALYLGVKAKDTAIQEARKAAQDHIKSESKNLLRQSNSVSMNCEQSLRPNLLSSVMNWKSKVNNCTPKLCLTKRVTILRKIQVRQRF